MKSLLLVTLMASVCFSANRTDFGRFCTKRVETPDGTKMTYTCCTGEVSVSASKRKHLTCQQVARKEVKSLVKQASASNKECKTEVTPSDPIRIASQHVCKACQIVKVSCR